MTNPLLVEQPLPNFSAIRPEHIEPAIDQILADNRAEVARLSELPVRNYLEFAGRLEEISDRLAKAWSPVSHLNSVCNSPEIRAAYNACLPKLTEYGTELAQNLKLFERYQTLLTLPLSDEHRKVVTNAVRDFKLSGVTLPEAQRKQYGALATELAQLSAKFSENLLDATTAWTKAVAAEELEGLPEHALQTARAAAEAKSQQGLLLTLEQPCYAAVMTHSKHRHLRREMYEAYMTRASELGPHAGQWDNGSIMARLLKLRHEMAGLLGFPSYAHYSLATKMAETPEQVLKFLRELSHRSRAAAKNEIAELNDFARSELGLEQVTSWDAAYVSEALRLARYSISEEALRPYFPMERVLKGMFEIVRRIFEIDVLEVPRWDSWHETVRCFEVRRGGQLIGQFFLDAYARQQKRGGAWMDDCRVRRRRGNELQLPVAYLTCNSSAPVGDRPATLTHSEVTTLFHEFGHGLHHLLTQVESAPVSGIGGVLWDAVELPSQIMENWCWQADAIGLISGHSETGAPLPDALLRKMLAAKNFQSAMFMARQLEFGMFDMRIHAEFRDEPGFIRRVLKEVRDEVAALQPPDFARFENGFGHIFAGGYAAGYYSYKWAELLSADAFSAFEEEGIFNTDTGRRFRQSVLEVGGVVEPATAFERFRGRAPNDAALLRHLGITGAAA